MKEGSEKSGPERMCDICGKYPAVMHLTQVVNNQTTTTHLCEKCAAEKGLQTPSTPSNLPLADFLAQMGGEQKSDDGEDEEDPTCPFCGLTGKNFKEIGRLGCPQCYTTFEPSLRGLLRRIHGGTQHVGKVYLPPDPTTTELEKRLDALKRKLQRAIQSEDFERAAELRDEIRTLESVP